MRLGERNRKAPAVRTAARMARWPSAPRARHSQRMTAVRIPSTAATIPAMSARSPLRVVARGGVRASDSAEAGSPTRTTRSAIWPRTMSARSSVTIAGSVPARTCRSEGSMTRAVPAGSDISTCSALTGASTDPGEYTTAASAEPSWNSGRKLRDVTVNVAVSSPSMRGKSIRNTRLFLSQSNSNFGEPPSASATRSTCWNGSGRTASTLLIGPDPSPRTLKVRVRVHSPFRASEIRSSMRS